MKLAIITAHAGANCAAECLISWGKHARILVMDGRNGILPAFQKGFEIAHQDYGILAYLHDDLIISEPNWVARVMREFEDPGVGMVYFGGALGHGTSDLYTAPYKLSNLARQNFMSNMREAEKHGTRFTGERDVAIGDGFALIVRTAILEKVGGWPVDKPVGYFMYSEWCCCEARRQGYRVRLVGVECDHLGGRTATLLPVTDDYEEAHRYFYENNRDVMPYRISEEG